MDIGGHASSTVLAPVGSHPYTELNVAVASSDLARGIHRLWPCRSAFVAVTGVLR